MGGKILQVFNFLDIRSNDFLSILRNAGGNKFIKNMLLLFLKKFYFGENGPFWDQFGAKMMCSYNSGSTLRIFLKFSKMKEAKRYMKAELMVFLKNL